MVIDSADSGRIREQMLRKLCSAIDLRFDPAMLSWPPGPPRRRRESGQPIGTVPFMKRRVRRGEGALICLTLTVSGNAVARRQCPN